MVDMSQIANALGGFGAGLQGRGLEFAQQQNDQRRQAAADEQNTRLFGAQMREKDQEFEKKRLITQFTDAAAGLDFVNRGDYQGALAFVTNRKENLIKLGVEDTVKTDQYLQLTQLAVDGNDEAKERLKKTLEGDVSLGRTMKILDPAPKAEIVPQSAISSTGQVTTRQGDTFSIENLEGFKPDVTAGGKAGKATANVQDWREFQRLKKADPEGAKAFGTKVGFVQPDGTELSVHLQKRLSKANDQANESENSANQFEGLASQFEGEDISGGLFGGSWKETFKDLTGSQDAITALRKRYAGIRGSQVVNNLPPGAASDTDIKLALAGFPTDNATGKQITSFLNGVAKIERHKAAFNLFSAGYISEKGNEKGLIPAWKETQRNRPTGELSDAELSSQLGL